MNAPLGNATRRDATEKKSDEKKREIKNARDEVCRNILQRKPINKGRLGRGIKTHTSRYWAMRLRISRTF